MPSAVRPTNVARVSMLMRTDLLMNSIRTNSVDLLKVQNQLATGLRLARPSDSPAEATTIMHLDDMLERHEQYLNNIDYAGDYLATTDNALSQAVTLLQEALDRASESIGMGADDAGRAANAQIIDQVIQQMVSLANSSCRGSYIFAGQNSTQAPFEFVGDGIRFTGSCREMQTRVAAESLIDFSIDGNDTFGALSSEVIGIADLDPDITAATLLTDLNGAQGQGIRLGSIMISDGTSSATIDLSDCVTVGDVIEKINANAPTGTAVAIGVDGTSLQINAQPGADLTVIEVGTGYTARDLGIFDAVGGDPTILGQDVDARLTLATPVTALAGGAGIDTVSGMLITNSLVGSPATVDLSSATTLGDIINSINHAGVGVLAEINAAATGINVFNQMSGSQMSIGENGGTTATDLGIRSMVGSTQLADLNGGRGVETSEGVIQISRGPGVTYDVALDSAQTIQDVIDLINAATGGDVTAALTATGNGIELTNTLGDGNLSVTTISLNGSNVAQDLGLDKSVSGNTLVGDDVNPAEPDGLFSHLIALREALLSNDDAAITTAAAALEEDRKILSNMHGIVGAQGRALEDRRDRTEDAVLALQTLRSDIADIDFTEAITRYQNLYTALQGNLMTGSQLTNVSLLDFLE